MFNQLMKYGELIMLLVFIYVIVYKVDNNDYSSMIMITIISALIIKEIHNRNKKSFERFTVEDENDGTVEEENDGTVYHSLYILDNGDILIHSVVFGDIVDPITTLQELNNYILNNGYLSDQDHQVYISTLNSEGDVDTFYQVIVGGDGEDAEIGAEGIDELPGAESEPAAEQCTVPSDTSGYSNLPSEPLSVGTNDSNVTCAEGYEGDASSVFASCLTANQPYVLQGCTEIDETAVEEEIEEIKKRNANFDTLITSIKNMEDDKQSSSEKIDIHDDQNVMGSYDDLCLSKKVRVKNYELVNDADLNMFLGVQGPLQSNKTDHSALSGPTMDGTEETPQRLSLFSNNKTSLECCADSQFYTSNGCVCMSENQKSFLQNRGMSGQSPGFGL